MSGVSRVDDSALMPEGIVYTEQKIRAFASLPVGWQHGEGHPPSDSTIEHAIILNIYASDLGFKETNAFPGIEGEVQLLIYHERTTLEITLEIDDSVTFIHEQDDKEIESIENLTFCDTMKKLQFLKKQLCL